MKPIRDYTDGQWLLLLWAFIVVFLITGLALSRLVLVVSIVGAIGAAYTTYLYARERIGRSPTGSLFGPRGGTTSVDAFDRANTVDTVEPGQPETIPEEAPRNPAAAPQNIQNHEGGAQ